MKLLKLLICCISFGVAAQEDAEQVVANKADYLQSSYKKLFKQGRRNAVLNYMEIGSLAFKQGDLKEAKIAFLHAVRGIEEVYADNPAAEKVRSLWYQEEVKDFKGEPYERVMAYYYLGLIYLAEGELDNARASFVSGLMQDAYAEEEQHRADFALMHYLSAWTAQKMKSEHLADTALQRFSELRKGFPKPNESDNVLVIVESGKSPRKLGDGIGKYDLVYRTGKKFKDKQGQVSFAEQTIRLLPVEDIYWQASTRGGRAVDRIIKGKVNFAESSRDVGDALAKTGNRLVEWSAISDSGSALQDAGTALSVIGLAAKIMAIKVETKADTRYWKSLPNTVHVSSLNRLNVNDVKVDVLDKFGNVIKVKSLKTNIYKPKEGYTLVWAKSH